jgi:predicted GH43/DUF377 family glycosyl hydrolase
VKYSGNPVLLPGPAGSWDDSEVFNPRVIKDGAVFKIWYGGSDGIVDQVGYATSTDGISWTKHPTPVLGPGTPGSWDDARVSEIAVLRNESGTYEMWYSGGDGVNTRIGYATSNDGITWTKYSQNPVLDVNPSMPWENQSVSELSVVKDAATYRMWYTGNDAGPIGYATSSDAVTWTRHPSNPVFGFGSPGSWDEVEVDNPSVLIEGGLFHMWYGGGDDPSAIGYATSPDGVNWTRNLENPVLEAGPPGSWDEGGIDVPSVVLGGATYHMWYDGGGIGYASPIPSVPTLSRQGAVLLGVLLVLAVQVGLRRSVRRGSLA